MQRTRFETLRGALDALERDARELTRNSSRKPVDAKLRRFEPQQLVAARLEIAGPERLLPTIRGGVDIRGDGSSEAYTGWVRRELIEQQPGEDATSALSRELTKRAKLRDDATT